MSKKALVVWGGWNGHEPDKVADILARELRDRSFEVKVSDTLDAYKNEDLKALDLIVPIWTMGKIEGAQVNPLLDAVKGGVGLGGCHGGMCDSFRENVDYQFMTGGQWVAHPGNDGVEYTIEIDVKDHFITQGSPPSFKVRSEQYYLHTDPANQVLATTRFPIADGPHAPNGEVRMPQIWTKRWGEGRVYYNALGHVASVVQQPEVLRLIVRGLLWAAHAEKLAH